MKKKAGEKTTVMVAEGAIVYKLDELPRKRQFLFRSDMKAMPKGTADIWERNTRNGRRFLYITWMSSPMDTFQEEVTRELVEELDKLFMVVWTNKEKGLFSLAQTNEIGFDAEKKMFF